MSDSLPKELKYNQDDWEQIRKEFVTSMMVDTKISALAENLDSPAWPIEGDDETPDKYLDYSFRELVELPEMDGYPERVNLLMDILKETMAFDDPFGEMLEIVDSPENQEETLLKVLDKLGIKRDFPIMLSSLTDETKEFCKEEEIDTLGDFVVFSQNIAKNIVLGGDFRAFLNSLSNLDERGIAKYIPFRVSEEGLHLPEGVGQTFTVLTPGERAALMRKYGRRIDAEEKAKADEVPANRLLQIEQQAENRVFELFQYFKKDKLELNKFYNDDRALEKYFAVLRDPDLSFLCCQSVTQFYKSSPYAIKDEPKSTSKASSTPVASSGPMSEPEEEPKKRGFFSRLFGRG